MMHSLTLETPEMLQAILSSIDEGIHVIDSEGYTIYYNQVIAALDGLAKEEVIGQHVLDVFPSLNRHTSTLLRVIETGAPIINQTQSYVNIKGKRVDTVNSTLPIYVENRLVGAVEVAKDFSKIRQLSEQLLDLHAKVSTQPQARMPKNKHELHYTIDQFLTQHPAMLELKKAVIKVAQSNSPVLVYGETGTGKEIIVQALHAASPRSEGPFIAQNCAALPASLLESLLFGTTKGSFTGAVDRKGLFELAHGGTLFLDEINSMPMELQAKLLRVLQEGAIRRIGGHQTIPVNVRIVVALNMDPWAAIQSGKLRSDLYYRIQVVSFYLIPLRERKSDIPILIEYFIQAYAQEFGQSAMEVDPLVLQAMQAFDWPGNVRELKHAIEAAMNLAEGHILSWEHFPDYLQRHWREWYLLDPSNVEDNQPNQPFNSMPMPKRKLDGSTTRREKVQQSESSKQRNSLFQQEQDERSTEGEDESIPALRVALEQAERNWIKRALNQTQGNIKQAALLLQIPRQTLQYKMKKMDIDSAGF